MARVSFHADENRGAGRREVDRDEGRTVVGRLGREKVGLSPRVHLTLLYRLWWGVSRGRVGASEVAYESAVPEAAADLLFSRFSIEPTGARLPILRYYYKPNPRKFGPPSGL